MSPRSELLAAVPPRRSAPPTFPESKVNGIASKMPGTSSSGTLLRPPPAQRSGRG